MGRRADWWAWAKVALVRLLNLPLLALLGHVAFKVVQAYLFGPLLPSDYFLNALALVVLVTGSVLTSVTLAGATAAVRRAGRDHFEKGLDQIAHDALEQIGAPLQDARDAAAKLARHSDPVASKSIVRVSGSRKSWRRSRTRRRRQ